MILQKNSFAIKLINKISGLFTIIKKLRKKTMFDCKVYTATIFEKSEHKYDIYFADFKDRGFSAISLPSAICASRKALEKLTLRASEHENKMHPVSHKDVLKQLPDAKEYIIYCSYK